jgi:hypothetical protein
MVQHAAARLNGLSTGVAKQRCGFELMKIAPAAPDEFASAACSCQFRLKVHENA